MKNILLLALAVFPLAFTAAGCGGSYAAERKYWKAEQKYTAVFRDPASASPREFRGAVTALSRIVERYPSCKRSGELQFLVGDLYARRNDIPRARLAFERIVTGFPEQPELCARALFTLGLLGERSGDLPQALRKYEEIVERFPMTPTGVKMPLYIARLLGRERGGEQAEKAYATAVEHYQDIIDRNPYSNLVPALEHLVTLCYLDRRLPAPALVHLQKLVEKYPKSHGAPGALYEMGVIYRDILQQPEQMKATFERIVSEYPGHDIVRNVRLQLGSRYAAESDYRRATDEFKTILERYPSDVSLCAQAAVALAAISERSGPWEQALQEYRNVVKRYPQTVQALQVPLLIAAHYEREHNVPEAGKAYGDAVAGYAAVIRHNPGKEIAARAQEFTARTYILQGKFPDAIRALERFSTDFPRDPQAPFALFRMAVIYQQELKDSPKAIACYQRLVSKYPNHELSALARRCLETRQG